MNTTCRATVSSLATACLALTLAAPVSTQPGATKPPGAQTAAVHSPAAQPAKSARWLQKLKSWLQAVGEHAPGEADGPAKQVGRMTEAELEAVRADLSALVSIHQERRAVVVRYKDEPFTLSGIETLLGLTGEAAARSDANRILKRAAILHGDVAMLVVPYGSDPAGCSTQLARIVRDGNLVGSVCMGIHWAQGRALLDATLPDPRKDPMVELWYEATIAFLIERSDYANAVRQIDHAAALFPDAPGLLFEHGCYHESLASRGIQTAVQASGTGDRSASAYLKEAEGLFRRAARSKPDFVEARVHHGAVLGALRRHGEAADELRQAIAAAPEAVLRYYAELFLGDEEQALGRKDSAGAHYREASTLFPLAQSPWIALSALARRGGDRVESLSAIRRALDLPPSQRGRWEDPWWAYHTWFSRDAVTLFRDLYRPFVAGVRQ